MTDEIIKCIDCKYLDRWRSVEAAKKFGPGYVCRRGVLNIISESDYCSKAEKKQKTTGTWILHVDDLFPGESTQECDNCHHHQPLSIDDSFCPNCGIKMIGQKHGFGGVHG